MKIPLIDLVAQYRSIQQELDEALAGVLQSGHFILGPNVEQLEEEIAAYLGVEHAVAVASGTDALSLAETALGIGAGDEVIMPAYTFFATAETVMHLGATPVFVDIRPETYCLDVDQLASRITNRTKAIIPVHLYGFPADMEPLVALSRRYGIKLIEDNAQALGAHYHGEKTGSIGDIGCLSFFPSKNLGAFGDGGMVVTNHADLAQRVRTLRTHGWKAKYDPEVIGYNSRLDELQAAILRVKLKYLDRWNAQRRHLADLYRAALSVIDVDLPTEPPAARAVYHLYVVGVKERASVLSHLRKEEIGAGVYYPYPLHLTRPCKVYGYSAGQFPVSEQASRETLALPLYPEMTEDQLAEVVRSFMLALKTAAAA